MQHPPVDKDQDGRVEAQVTDGPEFDCPCDKAQSEDIAYGCDEQCRPGFGESESDTVGHRVRDGCRVDRFYLLSERSSDTFHPKTCGPRLTSVAMFSTPTIRITNGIK